jgi:hypothetical protein
MLVQQLAVVSLFMTQLPVLEQQWIKALIL